MSGPIEWHLFDPKLANYIKKNFDEILYLYYSQVYLQKKITLKSAVSNSFSVKFNSNCEYFSFTFFWENRLTTVQDINPV